LVLDEVGELPLGVQASLLRALASGEIQRVGAGRTEKVDVRVVAATNRDLKAEVAAGRFREDLYYRLAVVELLVPPLRERRVDVPLLAEALRKRLSRRLGLAAPVAFAPDLLAALAALDWPGNVRELENTVARLLTLAEPGEAGLDARALATLGGGDAANAAVEPAPSSAPLRVQVDAFERALVARTLAASGGNRSEAARRLGITRTTLIDKMKRYGLGRG
jgi:two-component system response regulator AtoC